MNLHDAGKRKTFGVCCLAALLFVASLASAASGWAQNVTQFVYTSDAHYGITRPSFRGTTDADGHAVNAAMVGTINALPGSVFPCTDDGVRSCTPVGWIDFVAVTGDIANRSEALTAAPVTYIQSAAASWEQFADDYLSGLTVKDSYGNGASLFLVPGNHDATNAVGFYKTMVPAADATAMAKMYNLMIRPAMPRTKDTFAYAQDKVFFSRDIGGVHFLFIAMWPDSAAREWIARDMAKVSSATPVVIFTHDQPDVEAKHFINPNPPYTINGKDKFENLLADRFADANQMEDSAGKPVPTVIEQRQLVQFLKTYKNIVAYFHGHSNKNEFYVYQGPDKDIRLNTFRVDSPMKGDVSGKDERMLSYQVISIDPAERKMTVREYLWNTGQWGDSTTVSLGPRIQ